MKANAGKDKQRKNDTEATSKQTQRQEEDNTSKHAGKRQHMKTKQQTKRKAKQHGPHIRSRCAFGS